MSKFFRLCTLALGLGLIILGLSMSAHADLATVGVICPATGTSIQAAAANGSRLSLVLLNDAGPNSVRFGSNNVGTLPVLNDTNSTILLQGASYSFNLPGLYYGRVICMSTTASPVTIHVSENTYP